MRSLGPPGQAPERPAFPPEHGSASTPHVADVPQSQPLHLVFLGLTGAPGRRTVRGSLDRRRPASVRPPAGSSRSQDPGPHGCPNRIAEAHDATGRRGLFAATEGTAQRAADGTTIDFTESVGRLPSWTPHGPDGPLQQPDPTTGPAEADPAAAPNQGRRHGRRRRTARRWNRRRGWRREQTWLEPRVRPFQRLPTERRLPALPGPPRRARTAPPQPSALPPAPGPAGPASRREPRALRMLAVTDCEKRSRSGQLQSG